MSMISSNPYTPSEGQTLTPVSQIRKLGHGCWGHLPRHHILGVSSKGLAPDIPALSAAPLQPEPRAREAQGGLCC